MKNIYLIVLILFLCSFCFDNNFKHYCNDRFLFCIDYPNNFEPQEKPENGDGLIFISKNKNSEIRAFGSLAIDVDGLDKLENEYKIATTKVKISYKKVEKDWFIFSGINNEGKIVYRKTKKIKINYMGQGNVFVFQTLMIKYPQSEVNIYQPYCKKIATSF